MAAIRFPPPPLAKHLVRRSLDRRLCLLRARAGIADDNARLDGVVAGSGFAFDPVIPRCVVSGESLATLVGQAVVGDAFRSGLALPADWCCVAPKPEAAADASSAVTDRSYAATTARMRRGSTLAPGQAYAARRAARAVRRSARGRIYLLCARADHGTNARIDGVAAGSGIAFDPVVAPRDRISLTTLADRVAVDANGALTVDLGEEIRTSPPRTTMVSAVEGPPPETVSKEHASSRSPLIVARPPAPASGALDALATPKPAGKNRTPQAAGTARPGPSARSLPSFALEVGSTVNAAAGLGTPIGDDDASCDNLGVEIASEGLGSATQQAITSKDGALSIAKVGVTLNAMSVNRKDDDSSTVVTATVDGRSPEVERVDVIARRMARAGGQAPLEPSRAPPSPIDAVIDQPRATPSRDAAYRALAVRRTFAAELRLRATSSPDDRTGTARGLWTGPATLLPCDALFDVEGALERPAPRIASTTCPAARADDRARCERAYEAWHRCKRTEARARREQLMEALVSAERERERRIDDRRAALRERHRRVEREKRALARARDQHRKRRDRRTRRPPAESDVDSGDKLGRLPAVLDNPCVTVAPEVEAIDARARAFEAVFLPKIVTRANNKRATPRPRAGLTR